MVIFTFYVIGLHFGTGIIGVNLTHFVNKCPIIHGVRKFYSIILDYNKHHNNTIPPCIYCKIHKSFTSLAKLLTRSSSTASSELVRSFSGTAYVRVHVKSIIIILEECLAFLASGSDPT